MQRVPASRRGLASAQEVGPPRQALSASSNWSQWSEPPHNPLLERRRLVPPPHHPAQDLLPLHRRRTIPAANHVANATGKISGSPAAPQGGHHRTVTPPTRTPSHAWSTQSSSSRTMCMDRPAMQGCSFSFRRAQCLRSCIRPRVRGRSAPGHDGLRGSTARQMVELKVRIVLGPWSIPVPPISPSGSGHPSKQTPGNHRAPER